MEISVIKIGNSKGIRLTKTLLERYQIKDKVELIFEKGRIILKSIRNPDKVGQNCSNKCMKMAMINY